MRSLDALSDRDSREVGREPESQHRESDDRPEQEPRSVAFESEPRQESGEDDEIGGAQRRVTHDPTDPRSRAVSGTDGPPGAAAVVADAPEAR